MKQSKKKSKKWLWIGGVVLLLVLIIAVALPMLGQRALDAQMAAADGEKATAFIGDLAANATASGQVQAQRQASLALPVSGVVQETFVAVGDRVAEGDSLVQLETADYERAILNAQQTLAIQEANLASLLSPPTAVALAAAEANVASAQANLADLLAGPSAEEIAAKEADLDAANAELAAANAQLANARSGASDAALQAAQIQLNIAQAAATEAAEQHSTVLVTEPNQWLSAEMLADMEFAARTQALQANATLAAAQESYNQLVNGDGSSVAAAQAQVALAAAQRDAAQASLDLLLAGSTTAQIAAAEATLAQAQSTLDQLVRGASNAQIVTAENAVAQARINLQRAENNLANTTLTAPFAGVVTAVNARQGEQASGVLVQLVDDASLEVVLEVDEVDIGNVSPGQTAVITFESWPNEEVTGEVAAIAPEANSDSSAVVNFTVYLSIGETDLPVLTGMTANANLITQDLSDVLLVPNAAIQVDREQGRFTVNRVLLDENDVETFEEVEVTIGLRDGRYTQILSGINEGDELLIGNAVPVFQFGPGGDGEGGGGPFGGGG
jgi:HlyD family secretion protein